MALKRYVAFWDEMVWVKPSRCNYFTFEECELLQGLKLRNFEKAKRIADLVYKRRAEQKRKAFKEFDDFQMDQFNVNNDSAGCYCKYLIVYSGDPNTRRG